MACGRKYQQMDLIEIDGAIVSELRNSDGYVNATRMCQSAGKLFGDYHRLQRTQRFLEVLSSTMGYPIVDLIKATDGGNGDRHSWVHPRVAINLAQWISPEFDVAVSGVVHRYLTGQVTTEESQAVALALQLPPPDVRVKDLTSSLAMWGINPVSHPRFTQAVQDYCGNLLGITGDKHDSWRGVVEIAEQMGYPSAIKADVRSSLGRFVKKRITGTDIEFKREERLCNGTMRPIFVYKDCDALRELIKLYFEVDE